MRAFRALLIITTLVTPIALAEETVVVAQSEPDLEKARRVAGRLEQHCGTTVTLVVLQTPWVGNELEKLASSRIGGAIILVGAGVPLPTRLNDSTTLSPASDGTNPLHHVQYHRAQRSSRVPYEDEKFQSLANRLRNAKIRFSAVQPRHSRDFWYAEGSRRLARATGGTFVRPGQKVSPDLCAQATP